jgi:SRSO17 transposase
MAYFFRQDGEQRLKAYFERIGRVLGRSERREAFALYSLGILGDCERKSVEPIAALVCGAPELCRAYTERLLNFLTESPWEDRPVRLCAARYALTAMLESDPSRLGSSTTLASSRRAISRRACNGSTRGRRGRRRIANSV